MKVLVTGGAGYLGCHVVKQLLERGHAVRVFDRFCFGNRLSDHVKSHPDFEIVKGDVRRLQEAAGLFEGVEAIIHLAALSNDPSCALDEERTEDINVDSVRELAHQAMLHGISRFVLASTCAVYGRGMFPFLDEASPPAPVSPYGATSLRAEQALLPLHNEKFSPVVARLATLFGVSPRMRLDLAVNQMVATAVHQKRIYLLGGGNQWRPFLHVQDAARAMLLLLDAPSSIVGGEVFNVGVNEGNLQIRALAERIQQFFPGVALEVARDDDDQRTFHVSFDKLLQRLDFKAVFSLEQGIQELQEWASNHQSDWTDDIYYNVRTLRRLLDLPVDEGGEPVPPRFVPLYRPTLGQEEERAVVETLRSGWLTSAARVPVFEKLLAESVGANHAVAVISCTAALHLCLVYAGVKPGDEVITSPLTWASTANTIVNMGATPVFVDVCDDTLNMDPKALEQAITPKTRAIIPVHLAGQPCDLDPIYEIARKHKVVVIEDAAHALGASYKGVPIGSYGEYTCFSFYAIKNITTIDGGAITLKNEEAASALAVLAHHGLSKSAWDRYGRSAAQTPDEVTIPGFKYRLSDVNAAIGIEQLKKFPAFKTARTRLARLYAVALADIEEIRLPRVLENIEHAWHLMIVRLKLEKLRKTRDEIREDLRKENIGTGLHFYGLHLHKFYRECFGWRPEDLPYATAASMDMLSLPLFPLMEERHVHQVAAALKKVIANARK
ncbi:MAG TPA: aminotransferase class I/II-fold pyridoxal phosphate-dependent enzyme [Candidatus Hydrogenedentes bacterium]|nr:aminotransferase class I/II-fold pyridoxal phosphate-dependent enzyme [Candidatus Hydrogenedentota bacterium]HOL77347.1 aminotransferase class I/II-fold pyridoxal phosphate-dependent enzyme [Candidatus Hydrogenedentota bacterium]HPO84835.1 aminotransferase class I/II-fold pyridoxal phosphate-dependent enzyme [Candidatus Hydrogenedentota bacterium]